ncbi:MAG TPA: hypothetical protein VGF16_11305 [Bryobacteraceae bacterium]|jgi:mono/diheme cytochrome c family protein
MHKYLWIAGLAAVAASAAPVTYNKDVLPILQKNCQGCHRPGQVAAARPTASE